MDGGSLVAVLGIGGDMKKLESLRKALLDAIPELKRDQESLLIFAEKGRIVSSLTPSLSFEYHYQGNLILTDYNGHADTIMVPLLVWARTNQPDLLMPIGADQQGIQFEAEILNHDTADISITLELSERVRVQIVNNQRVITHLDEPPLDDLTGPNPWDLHVNTLPIGQL